MLKFVIETVLNMIWKVAGQLAEDLSQWCDEAEAAKLEGKAAFEFVWGKAKDNFDDIGDWLLNFLIEAVVGKRAMDAAKLAKKLKWPAKLKINI